MLETKDITRQDRSRVTFIMIVIAGMFALIGFQLYNLQIRQYEEYARRSNQNAMRTVPVDAVRGRILDRNGHILVGNRPAYTLGVIPAEVRDIPRLDSTLHVRMDLPEGRLINATTGRRRREQRPVDLLRDAPFTTVAYLEEHRHEFPSVLYMVESRRRYPYGTLGAHFLGYVREIREQHLASLRDAGYRAGDLMGQSGIEAQYEQYLRGDKGEEYQEVTAQGRVLHRYRQEPVRGYDVRLSIDLDLQLTAEETLEMIPRGAVIAIDPNTGEVLALASRPTYDPAVFSFVVPASLWRQLNDDEERPMFDRATMGSYPPGSIAKMVTAIAALESGIIDLDTKLDACRGEMWFGDRVFRCWFRGGHGSLNVTQAIERSCNVFFYQLGRDLPLERWSATAKVLGLGERTGIDLPIEESGIVASREVYTQKLGRWGWTRGEGLNVAIGQGITLVTPLQMVRHVSALATGALPTPHLALGLIDHDGNEIPMEVPDPKPIAVDPALLKAIRDAMVLVTQGDHGTARRSRVPGYEVAGKTGTAQNPHGDSHSWYIGFVPAENPRIAVAAIAENAGHGSDIAAPIAGQVMRRYMLRDRHEITAANLPRKVPETR